MAIRFSSFGLTAVTALVTAFACTPGKLAAQIVVSDGGMPIYNFSLVVPPGIAGLSPRLSFAYTPGVDGPLGVGWSLQGASTIVRCAATVATDGVRRGIEYSTADKLCLDGQRLIPTDSDGSPLTGAGDDAAGLSSGSREYRTEIDTFARIRAYGNSRGSNSNGPAFFRVWTKSGLVFEYGNTDDSNIDAVGASTVTAAWAVNRVGDTVGNWMNFVYEKRVVAWGSGVNGSISGREWNLVDVRYTGSASQASSNRVHFDYVDRDTGSLNAQFITEAYHRGSKAVGQRLLVAARTYVSGSSSEVPVRVYKLAYDTNPNTSKLRLASIKDCRGANETICLPSTTFDYTSGSSIAFTEALSPSLTSVRMLQKDGAYGILTGDFNGDGKADIIRWSDTPSENQLYFSSPVSSGSLSTPDQVNFVAASSFGITDENLGRHDGCYVSMVADFDGDGRSDILRRAANGPSADGTPCPYGNQYIYFSNGDGTFRRQQATDASGAVLNLIRKKLVVTRVSSGGRVPVTYKRVAEDSNQSLRLSGGANFFLGDFDGDGRLDIVTTEVAPATVPVDGYADYMAQCSYACTKVYKGLGDGRFQLMTTTGADSSSAMLYVDPTLYSPRQRYFIDVDGDGLQDLYQPLSGTRYKSKGDGDFSKVIDQATSGCYYVSQVGDFNGDGKIDRICAGPNAATNALFISKGDEQSFLPAQFNLTAVGQELSTLNVVDPTTAPVGVGFVAIDLNADRRTDILRWEDDASLNKGWLSVGDGSFREVPLTGLVGVQLKKSDNGYDFVVGDFSGRGNADILRIADDPTQNKLYVRSDQSPPDLLTGVTSGTGSHMSVSYASLAQAGAPYASTRPTPEDPIATSRYPVQFVQPPLYVVAKASMDAGSSFPAVDTHYFYQDLKADWSGRGLLGFALSRHDAPGPNGEVLVSTSVARQDFPYIGAAATVTQQRGSVTSPGSTLSMTTNTFCDQTATSGCGSSRKVRKPFLQQTLEQGWDLNGVALPTVSTSNSFNGFGDATAITIQTSGSVGGVAQAFSKVTNNQFYANTSGDNWILGRLQRATVTNSVPDDVLTVASGTAVGATRTQGVPPSGYVSPSPLNPAVLEVILDILLNN